MKEWITKTLSSALVLSGLRRDYQAGLQTALDTDNLEDAKVCMQNGAVMPQEAALQAAHAGKVDATIFCLQNGASPFRLNSKGENVLHIAVRERNLPLAQKLLRLSPNLMHRQSAKEQSPHDLLMQKGNRRMLSTLARQGLVMPLRQSHRRPAMLYRWSRMFESYGSSRAQRLLNSYPATKPATKLKAKKGYC